MVKLLKEGVRMGEMPGVIALTVQTVGKETTDRMDKMGLTFCFK